MWATSSNNYIHIQDCAGRVALYYFEDDDNEEDVLCTEKRENKYLFTTLSCIYIISQTIYNDVFFRYILFSIYNYTISSLRFSYSPTRIAFQRDNSSMIAVILDFSNVLPLSMSSVSKDCKV